MMAPTSTLADGCTGFSGSSKGHPPRTRVSKILFLPCSPELAVVDTVSPGVPHSPVQHHIAAETEPGLNTSLWIWIQERDWTSPWKVVN